MQTFSARYIDSLVYHMMSKREN